MADLAQICDTPLVIGLYGGWGVGKTSLMQLIQQKLDPNPEPKCSVWFNPWEHQFDENPALALVHQIVDTLKMGEEGKKLLTVIAAAFGSALLHATTNLTFQDMQKFGERFEEERFQVREARVRLRDYFKDLTKTAREKVPKKEVKEEDKRLFFFIDDLDRCLPRQTLSMLESLKLYLNQKGCVYFLAIDRQMAEVCIWCHYQDLYKEEEHLKATVAQYLDKIVQLPFSIPRLAAVSIRPFVDAMLIPQELNRLDDLKDLLVEGLDYNPRGIKRFINTLILSHQLLVAKAKRREIDKYNPTVLAALLLIQNQYPELYHQIERQPILLKELKTDSEKEEALKKRYVGDERLMKVLAAVAPLTEKEADLIPYIYQVGELMVKPHAEQAGPKIDLELIISS